MTAVGDKVYLFGGQVCGVGAECGRDRVHLFRGQVCGTGAEGRCVGWGRKGSAVSVSITHPHPPINPATWKRGSHEGQCPSPTPTAMIDSWVLASPASLMAAKVSWGQMGSRVAGCRGDRVAGRV